MESGPTEGWLLWEQVLMLQSLLKQAQGRMAQQVQVQTEAQVQRGILQESQKLLQWAENIQAQLCSKEELEDVASTQQLLRKHGALQEETCLWRERSGRLEDFKFINESPKQCVLQGHESGWYLTQYCRQFAGDAQAYVRQPGHFRKGLQTLSCQRGSQFRRSYPPTAVMMVSPKSSFPF